jgi:hypothetical protein
MHRDAQCTAMRNAAAADVQCVIRRCAMPMRHAQCRCRCAVRRCADAQCVMLPMPMRMRDVPMRYA